MTSVDESDDNRGGEKVTTANRQRTISRTPWVRPFVSILVVTLGVLFAYFYLYARNRMEDRIRVGVEALDQTAQEMKDAINAHRDVLELVVPQKSGQTPSAQADKVPNLEQTSQGVESKADPCQIIFTPKFEKTFCKDRREDRKILATTDFSRVCDWNSQQSSRSSGSMDDALSVCIGTGADLAEIAIMQKTGVGFLKLKKYLTTRGIFDHMIVVDRTGRVFSRSKTGPSISGSNVLSAGLASNTPLETLRPAASSARSGIPEKAQTLWGLDPLGWADLPRFDFSGIKFVRQCVFLALSEEDRSSGIHICGLIEESRLRQHALELSPLSYTWALIPISCLFLSLPYVKVRYMGKRERLRKVDLALLVTSVSLIAGLGVLLVAQMNVAIRIQSRMDDRLSEYLATVKNSFDSEISSAIAQLDSFRTSPEIQKMLTGTAQTPGCNADERLGKNWLEAGALDVTNGMLMRREFSYKLFEVIALSDYRVQKRKWTPRLEGTPLHDVSEYGWYKDALENYCDASSSGIRRISDGTNSCERDHFFGQTLSKISALNLAILAFPIDVCGSSLAMGSNLPLSQRSGIAVIATKLQSIQNSVSPHSLNVMIIKDGRILFHSNGRIRSVVRADDQWGRLSRVVDGASVVGATTPVTLSHLGAEYRVSVIKSNREPGVALVGYYKKEGPEAVASQAMRGPFLFMFILIAMLFAAGLTLGSFFEDAYDWIWPTDENDRVYIFCGVVFFVILISVLCVPRFARAEVVPHLLVLIAVFIVTLLAIGWRRIQLGIETLDAIPSPIFPNLRIWRLYHVSYLIFIVGLVATTIAAPVWVIAGDSAVAHEQAYFYSLERKTRENLGAWLDRLNRSVITVPGDSIKEIERDKTTKEKLLRPTMVPVKSERRKEYLNEAIGFGCHIGGNVLSDGCGWTQGANEPIRDRLSCKSLVTFESLPPFRFSVPFSACWARLVPTGMLYRAELSEMAWSRINSLSVLPETSSDKLRTGLVLVGIIGLLSILAALVYLVAVRILGLRIEKDGVIDRMDSLDTSIRRAILLRPSSSQVLEVIDRMGLEAGRILWVDAKKMDAVSSSSWAHQAMIVRGVERVLGDPESCQRLRSLIETSKVSSLILQTDIDPLYFLSARSREREGAERDRLERESEMWARLLFDFERIRFALPISVPTPNAKLEIWVERECGWDVRLSTKIPEVCRLIRRDGLEAYPDRMVELVLDLAEPYYRHLWSICSVEERLVLRQLADEGVVNPQSFDVLRRLRRRRLVKVGPRIRVANESFRRFVQEVESHATIRDWERPEGEESIWSRARGPLFAAGIMSIALFAWANGSQGVAAITTATGVLPAIRNLASMLRGGGASA